MEIKKLKKSEVFVFGSNEQGFHGAGAAGYALRGDSRNNWRQDQWFLKAMRAQPGSRDRIGMWAVYGVAKGFQQGNEGMSYAIITKYSPSSKILYPIEKIEDQIRELFSFAVTKPDLIFLMTPVGGGLAGHALQSLDKIWQRIFSKKPLNVIASIDLYKSVMK